MPTDPPEATGIVHTWREINTPIKGTRCQSPPLIAVTVQVSCYATPYMLAETGW